MVDVRVPTRLSSRQRELLEELAVELGEGDAGHRRPPTRPARRPADGAKPQGRQRRGASAGWATGCATRSAERRGTIGATRTKACPRPAPGSSCRSAPTRRQSSRSARSCRASARAASRSRRHSSCVDEGLSQRASTRRGRPSCAATSLRLIRPPRKRRRRRGAARPGPSAGLRAAPHRRA